MNNKEYIENLYQNYTFINFDKLNEYEDELVEYNDYIPLYIIRFINPIYFTNLDDDKSEKVYKQLSKQKFKTEKEKVDELINWVKNNQRFNNLVDWETVKQIQEYETYLNNLQKETKDINKGVKYE